MTVLANSIDNASCEPIHGLDEQAKYGMDEQASSPLKEELATDCIFPLPSEAYTSSKPVKTDIKGKKKLL